MIRRLFFTLALTALALGGCAAPRAAWVRQGFSPACAARRLFTAAAAANAAGIDSLAFSPFGGAETGWRIYAPSIALEIGTVCAPETEAFAEALAGWQAHEGIIPDGRITPDSFDRMRIVWQDRRGFVALRAKGVCPDAPPEAALVHVDEDEALMAKPILVTPRTLTALRAMRRVAARDLSLRPGDPTLAVFSAFRSPGYDAERCARATQGCDAASRRRVLSGFRC